jgi:hypothetical protein
VCTVITSVGLVTVGLGFAMDCNIEMMCAGTYVLMECAAEWFSLGPSWFRRRMIMMDYVLYVCGQEEDAVEEQQPGTEPGKKTRMTLKEFMMSDSQRAQVEQIDWEKDITPQERFQTILHYCVKTAFFISYVLLVIIVRIKFRLF